MRIVIAPDTIPARSCGEKDRRLPVNILLITGRYRLIFDRELLSALNPKQTFETANDIVVANGGLTDRFFCAPDRGWVDRQQPRPMAD